MRDRMIEADRADRERMRAERALHARDVALAAMDEAVVLLDHIDRIADRRTFEDARGRVHMLADYARASA